MINNQQIANYLRKNDTDTLNKVQYPPHRKGKIKGSLLVFPVFMTVL